jgi:hypothetical protein
MLLSVEKEVSWSEKHFSNQEQTRVSVLEITSGVDNVVPKR